MLALLEELEYALQLATKLQQLIDFSCFQIFDQYPWLLSPGAIAGAVVGTLFVLLLLVAIGVVLGQRCVKKMDLKVGGAHANFKDEEEDDEELGSEARTSDEPSASEKAGSGRPGLDDSEDSRL